MKMATRNLLLLVFSGICFLSFSAVSADVYEVIDCGSSDLIYTDENTIVWSGDTADVVSNGVTRTVLNSNSLSHVMDTMRVFTTLKKNCYTVPAGGQVIARASFYYGNYDQKSSPPSFDLQFDGNHWATVETTSDSVVNYEVIYVVKGDTTSICLAQTNPGQFPFISALEIRSLGDTMYDSVDENYALFLRARIAFGTNKTIRYMDDVYDRIWIPSPGGNGLIPETNPDYLEIMTEGDDNPPQAMLANAVTTAAPADTIQLQLGSALQFPAAAVPAYINLYFSEVSQLDATQTRSFTWFMNNKSVLDPISPPFGNFSEYTLSNAMVSSNTTLSLVAGSGSLPPLVNGMEVFYISNPLTNGTNSNDVAGLDALQGAFDVLSEWGGDPCLPAPYSWEWVNCTNDAIPRITALYLSSFNLSGELPDISSMDSLETIDLHKNSLSGPIPDSLGSLPNLKQLNLADNQFSGAVPASLTKKNNLNLVVTGNPDLCTSGKSCESTPSTTLGSSPAAGSGGGKKSSSKLPVILGTTIPIGVIIWGVLCVFIVLHYKRKSSAVSSVNAGQNGGGSGGGVNAQAVGKVGMAFFKAYMRNEAATDNNDTTTSSSNQTQTA